MTAILEGSVPPADPATSLSPTMASSRMLGSGIISAGVTLRKVLDARS